MYRVTVSTAVAPSSDTDYAPRRPEPPSPNLGLQGQKGGHAPHGCLVPRLDDQVKVGTGDNVITPPLQVDPPPGGGAHGSQGLSQRG